MFIYFIYCYTVCALLIYGIDYLGGKLKFIHTPMTYEFDYTDMPNEQAVHNSQTINVITYFTVFLPDVTQAVWSDFYFHFYFLQIC